MTYQSRAKVISLPAEIEMRFGRDGNRFRPRVKSISAEGVLVGLDA